MAMAGALLTFLPLGAEATAKSLSSEQLLSLIQTQQRQLDALKAALESTRSQADAAEAAAGEAKNAATAAPLPGMPNSIKIGGAAEVEVTNTEAYSGADSSDITLAKVELYIDVNPHEYLATHVQLLYEDDGNENITLDEAFATVGNTEKHPLYLQVCPSSYKLEHSTA